MNFLKKISIASLIFICLLTSCAKIYYAPDARTLASNHHIVAIMPPSVSIAAQRKVDAGSIKEQEITESLNFQNEMYSWMLKRKTQNKFTPELQDMQTTNAKLKKAGYPETPLSPSEACEILGVDGIITSNYSLSKPMSEGGAIALNLLVGAYGATNQVTVSMSIHDSKTKKMIWNYNHKYSGGIGSNAANLVDGLMKNASKNMPYMD